MDAQEAFETAVEHLDDLTGESMVQSCRAFVHAVREMARLDAEAIVARQLDEQDKTCERSHAHGDAPGQSPPPPRDNGGSPADMVDAADAEVGAAPPEKA